MNPSELNYQVVSSFDQTQKLVGGRRASGMESGKNYRQFVAGFIVNLASVAVGTCLSWPSSQTFYLQSEDPDVNPLGKPITDEEASWIGSLVAVGAIFGPLIAGFLAERIGRKTTLLSSTIFFVVSFVLLALVRNLVVIFIARLLQGLGAGFVMSVQSMYVAEIATDSSRGALGSLMQLFIVTGILYMNCVGPYNTYQVSQWIALLVPILFAILFWFMPESPYYYVQKGKLDEAAESLSYLRGKSKLGVKDEVASIEATVTEAMQEQGRFVDLFINKGNLRALIISSGLIAFQQLSGINAILFYTKSIFERTGSALDSSVATIIVCIVQVLASGCTPLIADRLGRKLILLVSAGGMAISLFFFGLYFLLGHIKPEIVPDLGWLPVTALIGFVTVYCVGFGPLPWAVLGEMFPANVKSIAVSVVTCFCWVLGFLVAKYFSTMDEALGSHWAFWVFGIFCVVAFCFVLTVVMETKGLSLREIQDRLNGR